MAKTYFMRFGYGDPRQYCGLNPTLVVFKLENNTNVTAPSVSQVGSSSGIYYFTFGTTQPITFIADAATTSPGIEGRYVFGSIDPADRTDEYAATIIAIGTSTIAFGSTLFALGTTNFALGTTNIAIGTSLTAQGSTIFSLGTTNVALGTTAVAIGTTILSTLTSGGIAGIGSTASSFGTLNTDPVDLFGYMKRIQENLEGNQTFIKSSGAFTILSRGSSVTLANKTIANSVSTVIKT